MVENLERKELSFFKIFLNLERERECMIGVRG